MNKKNKIFIISGPSGAGDDSVIKGLKKKIKFERIKTTVTRKKRFGERQEKPYYFISIKKFKEKIRKGDFIEWAVVYGDYRGCTKKEINKALKLKKPILLKIDWQGVKTIKKIFPQTIAIFIAPPSYEILKQRLTKRGLDSSKTIKGRENFTKGWLKHKNVYNHIVINQEGKLKETIKKVEKIIKEYM